MTWAKLDDQIFLHPKVIDRSKDAKLLFLAGITYCAGQLTDGLITAGSLRMICAQVDVARETSDELVAAGLWEITDGGYHVHDYLTYNPSRKQVLDEKAKTATRVANFRGRNPGYNDRYRDRTNGEGNTESNGMSNAVTTGVSNAVSTPSPSPSPSPSSEVTDDSERVDPPTFVAAANAASDEQSAPSGADGKAGEASDSGADAVAHAATTSTPATTRKRKATDPLPEDGEAMRLATLLRDRIRAHTPDARVPATTAKLQSWGQVFDLMLRIEKRAPPEIEAVITFATTDRFWQANILSPGSLRDKWDSLNIRRRQQHEQQQAQTLQAQRERNSNNGKSTANGQNGHAQPGRSAGGGYRGGSGNGRTGTGGASHPPVGTPEYVEWAKERDAKLGIGVGGAQARTTGVQAAGR